MSWPIGLNASGRERGRERRRSRDVKSTMELSFCNYLYSASPAVPFPNPPPQTSNKGINDFAFVDGTPVNLETSQLS